MFSLLSILETMAVFLYYLKLKNILFLKTSFLKENTKQIAHLHSSVIGNR